MPSHSCDIEEGKRILIYTQKSMPSHNCDIGELREKENSEARVAEYAWQKYGKRRVT